MGSEMCIRDRASDGIVFELEDGSHPVVAEVGDPVSAFGSNFGGDTPAPDQGVGSFFLTDDGVLAGLLSPALIVSYDPPTSAASGVILDIDLGEEFTIEAKDDNGRVVDTITLTAGDLLAGDGVATPWSFSRINPDIYSIRFEGLSLIHI